MNDTWRKDPPTEPGWYWVCDEVDQSAPCVPGKNAIVMPTELVINVAGNLIGESDPMDCWMLWGPPIPSAEEARSAARSARSSAHLVAPQEPYDRRPMPNAQPHPPAHQRALQALSHEQRDALVGYVDARTRGAFSAGLFLGFGLAATLGALWWAVSWAVG